MERHEDVLIALRRIMRAIDLHSRRLMQATGLTGPQLLLLRTVGRAGPLTLGELARTVNLSQGTVTSILDRLEARGLMCRRRSPDDRRRVLAELTPAGNDALSRAPTLLQEHFIERFHALQDWEQNLMLSSLQRVAEMMDAQDLDAAPLLESRSLEDS